MINHRQTVPPMRLHAPEAILEHGKAKISWGGGGGGMPPDPLVT